MRYRITVRSDAVELRGYADFDSELNLADFAASMAPVGMVVASVAADDYNPFHEENLRELHHFEVEEESARLREVVADICATYGHKWRRKMRGRFCQRCETFEAT